MQRVRDINYDNDVELGDARRYLYRAEWREFPDVLICSSELEVKRHPHYAAAKVGDAKSAHALVEDILAKSGIEQIRSLISRSLISSGSPRMLAVHALESAGMNAIPRVFAYRLAREFDLSLESGISQLNRVTHTGQSGYHRLAFPAVFDGLSRKANYVLVDDFIGQGGTIANLRGHVHKLGGNVLGAIALAGKHYSSKLQPSAVTLQQLRGKHGNQLEEWWISTFGYGLDRLTESEALYLFRSDSFDVITTRLATARRTGN